MAAPTIAAGEGPSSTLSGTESALRSRLAVDFTDIPALRDLGIVYARHNRAAEAVALLSDVVERQPDVPTLIVLASGLRDLSLFDESDTRLHQALKLDPDNPDANSALGGLFYALGRPADAIGPLRHALEFASTHEAATRTLADSLLLCGNAAFADFDGAAAECHYREAIALCPDFTSALGNLGHALTLQLRLDDALSAYRAALAVEPDHAGFGFAYALCLLRAGRFAEAWPYHERRFAVTQMLPNYNRRPELPRWRPGIDLAGKRVLLLAEQGHGDVIQYARYAPLLAAQGADVILELPSNLRRLFGVPPGVGRVISLDDPAPGCDLVCPLLSLGFYFGTTLDTIPDVTPYLQIPEDILARWSVWLGPGTGRRRIGLVCSGDPKHPHDRLRSVPLATLKPLLDQPDTEFILLQTDLRDSDRATSDAAPNLRFPGPALTDFADTAALMSHLDLVISVDTAVAHLAGALGLPAWVMLPYSPDYRWLLGRDDSPWYPSLRLYRQTRPGDWDTVIQAVQRDLTRA